MGTLNGDPRAATSGELIQNHGVLLIAPTPPAAPPVVRGLRRLTLAGSGGGVGGPHDSGPRRPWRRVPPWAYLALLAVVVTAVIVSLVLAQGPAPAPQPTPRPGPAETFFVSPHGSDAAPGTQSSPLRTLRSSLERLQPGDTLIVGAGEYHEELRDLTLRSGTKDRRIAVLAAPGAHPVLVGLLWLHDADYWDISGLSVRWDNQASETDHMVKFSGGTGWTFRNAELSQARSFAALLISDGARRFLVSGLYVHNTVPANGDNQDHLIYVNTDARGGIIERSILAGSPNGRAIKIGPPKAGRSKLGDLVIRYNTMVDNLGPSNIRVSYNVSDVQIYRNILVNPAQGSANVTGFHLSGRDNTVSDNMFFGSTAVVDTAKGLADAGGNIFADPQFQDPSTGNYRTNNPVASGYGRYAIG